jgi:hypothetical protein
MSLLISHSFIEKNKINVSKKYKNIFDSKKEFKIFFNSLELIIINKFSFYKICLLLHNNHPEKIIKFTKLKLFNNNNFSTFNITNNNNKNTNNNFKNSTEKILFKSKIPPEEEISSSRIDKSLFSSNKTISRIHCTFLFLYPIFLLFSFYKIFSIYWMYYQLDEYTFGPFETFSYSLVLLLFNLSIYGFIQMRLWYVGHFLYLNILIIIIFFVNACDLGVPMYIYWVDYQINLYVMEDIFWPHIYYHSFLACLLILAVYVNCYLRYAFIKDYNTKKIKKGLLE